MADEPERFGWPALPFDWSHAPPGSIAYDIVTAPLDTPFLQGARAKGHRTIDGLSMLIGQAALAEQWRRQHPCDLTFRRNIDAA